MHIKEFHDVNVYRLDNHIFLQYKKRHQKSQTTLAP